MAAPKKHHFIPQFYLRRFADRRENFWLYRKTADSKGIPTKVSDAGAENHFHTLDWSIWGQLADDQSTLETKLSGIEGEQATMLRAVLDLHEEIDFHEEALAQFTTMMWHRVPNYKRSMEAMLSKVLSHTGRAMLKAGRFPPPPEELRQMIEEKDGDVFHPVIANWKLLEMMFTQLCDTPIPRILMGMNAKLVQPESLDHFFIIGDAPVSLYDDQWDSLSSTGVGFATPTVEVTMPLSSSAMLVFRHDRKLPPTTLTAAQVSHYNQRTIISAEKSIHALRSCGSLAADIQRLSDQRAGREDFSLPRENVRLFISRNRPVTPDQLTWADAEES